MKVARIFPALIPRIARLIGAVADRWNMGVGFAVVSAALVIGGLLWVWGTRYLQRDTEQAAPNVLQDPSALA